MLHFDCVIIGAGIAGMTSAIYLKRANINVLILDNDAPGGLLNKINVIENYPGFKSISGPELAYKIYEQVQNLDIEIRYGKVISIEKDIIKTDIEQIQADRIIIATGRQAKQLKETTDAINVSYCAVCDGNLYKDKKVVIIGNNNSIDDIKYLKTICSDLTFISAEQINFEIDNVEIIDNCNIKKLNKEENKIVSIETNKGIYSLDGVFISMGYEPKMDFLDKIKKDNGYIIVNDKMQTNLENIYACGDCIKKDIYQLTTAVSEATKAAINIKKSLNKKN